MSKKNKYPWVVVLAAEFCGTKTWGAQSEHHANILAKDLADRGCEVISVELA